MEFVAVQSPDASLNAKQEPIVRWALCLLAKPSRSDTIARLLEGGCKSGRVGACWAQSVPEKSILNSIQDPKTRKKF